MGGFINREGQLVGTRAQHADPTLGPQEIPKDLFKNIFGGGTRGFAGFTPQPINPNNINAPGTAGDSIAPFNFFQGGRASEFNPRGQALRSLGFTGEFNQGKGATGFTAGGFLEQGGQARQQQFQNLFDQFSAEQGQVDSTTGVVPIGVVEPLSQTTRQGITRISGGPDQTGITALGQGLQGRLATAFESATAGTQPITEQQFQDRFNRFSNPFQQQVVDRAIENINRQESIRQNQLAQFATSQNAFGGTAQGVQAGILGGEALRNIGDITASLNAANFQQARDAALQDLSQERARQFTGAQIGGQLAGVGSGIGSATQQQLAQNLQNLLTQGQAEIGAGGIVQAQNQSVLDAIRGERESGNLLRDQQLQQALEVIRAFSGGGSGFTPGTSNTGGNILGGALVGNQLFSGGFGDFFGGGGGGGGGGTPVINPSPFGGNVSFGGVF